MRVAAVHHVERVLAWSAGLLFGLSAVLWWRSGTSGLTVGLAESAAAPPETLRWWAAPLIAAAIASAVGCLLVHRLPVGWAMAGVGGYTLLMAGVGAAIWHWVLPEPHPFTAVGPAVPATLLGFAVAVVAGLLLALALSLRGAASGPHGYRPSRRSAVGCAAVALSLAMVVGTAVLHMDSGYLQRTNEYRSAGDLDRAPGPTLRSSLSGGSRWQLQVPGVDQLALASTPYGLVVGSGVSVVAIDTDTGKQRWRYSRADVLGHPQVKALEGGSRLLVWWDSSSPYVLDSRTGIRLAHWTWPQGQLVLLSDPLIVARPIRDGTAIVSLSPTGEDVWSHALSSCEHAGVTRSGGIVVVSISDSCPGRHDRVLGLATDTGRVQWTADDVAGSVLALTSRVAVLGHRNADFTEVTALRLSDGVVSWRRPVQLHHQKWACDEFHLVAAGDVAIDSCGFEESDPDFAWHPVAFLVERDIATGLPRQFSAYDHGIVDSLAIDGRGRRIVTHSGLAIGCVLSELTDRGEIPRVTIDAGDMHHCAAIGVLVRGDQVILIDQHTETISSLR